MKKRVDSGITLIALVITIIVLLILAGVTITSISGNNGLIERAKDAKQETAKGQILVEVLAEWNGIYIVAETERWPMDRTATEFQTKLGNGATVSVDNTNNSIIHVEGYKGYDITLNTETQTASVDE